MASVVGNSDGDDNSGIEQEVLPYDSIINILKRIPVKFLARFNCVAKDWAKLFTTPHFIQQHLRHSSLENPLLLLQRIPQKKHPFPPTSPSTAITTTSLCLIGPDYQVRDSQIILDLASPDSKIIGSINGLLCFRHTHHHAFSICNPATRQLRHVPPPGTLTGTYEMKTSFCYIGFGFSPVVNDYKIVRVSVCDSEDEIVVLDDVRVNRAEVYSLSTDSWREIDASKIRTLCLVSNSVAANGAVFWRATLSPERSVEHDPEVVVSFDVAMEEFSVLEGLPSSPDPCHSDVLAIYNDKLAAFRLIILGNFQSSVVELWVFDDKNWIRQYRVGPFPRIMYPLSIWRDDAVVCREESSDHVDGHNGRSVQTNLSIFNPHTNELKNLPAHRNEYFYASFSYSESLVPLAKANIQHE